MEEKPKVYPSRRELRLARLEEEERQNEESKENERREPPYELAHEERPEHFQKDEREKEENNVQFSLAEVDDSSDNNIDSSYPDDQEKLEDLARLEEIEAPTVFDSFNVEPRPEKEEKAANAIERKAANETQIDFTSSLSMSEYLKQKEIEAKKIKKFDKRTKKWLTKAYTMYTLIGLISLATLASLAFCVLPSLTHMMIAAMNLGFNSSYKEYINDLFWQGGIPVLAGPAWGGLLITIVILLLIYLLVFIILKNLYKKAKNYKINFKRLLIASLDTTEAGNLPYEAKDTNEDWGYSIANSYENNSHKEQKI